MAYIQKYQYTEIGQREHRVGKRSPSGVREVMVANTPWQTASRATLINWMRGSV